MPEVTFSPEPDQTPELELENLRQFIQENGPEALRKLRATRRNVSSRRNNPLDEADRIDDATYFLAELLKIAGVETGKRPIETVARMGRVATTGKRPPVS